MGKVALPAIVGLEHSTDGGSTWTTVPGILSVDIGNITAEEVDVTDADSSGAFREFASGFLAADEGSITMHNAPRDTKLMELRTARDAGTVEDFRVEIDGEHTTFQALVKSFSEPFSIGEKLVVTMAIKLTGQPTYAAVA